MATTFKTLQDEIKRRGTRDQSGTTFDAGIKNIINFSISRIATDAPWRTLRRKTTFDTVTSYTKGSTTGGASVTSGSTTVTVPNATFITDGVQIGRKVKITASGTYYYIKTIPSETTFTVDMNNFATTSTGNTYEILPQEEYVLPMQISHRIFMWHEMFGYPYFLRYVTDMDFYTRGLYLVQKYPPTNYRMWGEDMVLNQVREPSVLSLASSSSSDVNISVMVFGTVSGYPDYEIITTDPSNGSATVNGLKTFSYVERVSKSVASTGRITCSANTAQDTITVLPVGDTTSGPLYAKVQLYPLPNMVAPIHVQYYKNPYDLINDSDVHELGEDFNEAIILLSVAKIKAEANLAEADRFMQFYIDEMRHLKTTNCDKFDWMPSLRRPRQSSVDALVAPNLLFRQVGGTGTFGPSGRF